jgi:inosine-uridine nucleoside N-ribohydrolase
MRGMTVVDWFGLSQQQPNVEIIQKVNWERLIESMKSIIA